VIDDGGVHECKTVETVTVERQNISLQKQESQMTELCENGMSRNTMGDRVIVHRRCLRIVRPTRSSICCFGFGYMVSLLHAQLDLTSHHMSEFWTSPVRISESEKDFTSQRLDNCHITCHSHVRDFISYVTTLDFSSSKNVWKYVMYCKINFTSN
jgi:hypothetical protein